MEIRSIDLAGDNVYDWVKILKRFWESVLHLVYFIVTSTADYTVEIAARAIAIAAPLPNAISVYKISQVQLGFSPVAAFAFAVVVEIAVFELVELSLYLFDGWLNNGRKWLLPFSLTVLSLLVGVSIIIGLVYSIETASNGHPIMAWLPVISLCAFLSIGLKRWHDRQPEMSGKNWTKRRTAGTKMSSSLDKKVDKILDITTGASGKLDKKVDKILDKIQKRQLEMSNILSENGPTTITEISRLLGSAVSDKTIRRDLDEMLEQGRVFRDGRRWSAISTRLPELSAPTTNGHGR